jgi:hypothetical protein
MIEQLWLIADAGTGDVSYVRHGLDGDESNWKTIGPFAYTHPDTAMLAADHRKFLPAGATGEFQVLEVEASTFVQAIFNGFPPSNTDVIALDEGLFPLTSGGAVWVDEAIGTPVWGPLFDEDGATNGLTWLDRVLEQVAHHLDMNMETVEAIGTLNAAQEDVAADIEQTTLLIQQHVRVAITPEHDTDYVGEDDSHHHLPADTLFWLHTRGMETLGLPELEIRNVPSWWVTAAGGELNGWAAYSLDRGISEGDTLDGGGPVPLKIRAVESPDPFWSEQGIECLRLEVERVLFSCGSGRHTPDGTDQIH